MSHTEAKEVTYLNGHRVKVGGRVYAPERTCRNLMWDCLSLEFEFCPKRGAKVVDE